MPAVVIRGSLSNFLIPSSKRKKRRTRFCRRRLCADLILKTKNWRQMECSIVFDECRFVNVQSVPVFVQIKAEACTKKLLTGPTPDPKPNPGTYGSQLQPDRAT